MDLKTWRIFNLFEEEFFSTIKVAYVFGHWGKEVLIVTKDDDVLAFGLNNGGRLGLGHRKSTDIPTRIEELCGKKVVGFCSGDGPHVLAYTETGEVYFWGYTRIFRNSVFVDTYAVPSVIESNLSKQVVVKVACGKDFCLALTNNGKVFCWSPVDNPKPYPVLSELTKNKKIVSMACGSDFSFLITDNGELYTWGKNECGQLGLGDTENRDRLCHVHVCYCNKVVVTRVVCGKAYTLALTDLGALYAWGDNANGQLGTGDQNNAYRPILVAAKVGCIVDIAATCSSNISAAITRKLKVYVWGSCNDKCVLSPVVTSYSSLHDIFAYIAKPRVTWQPIHFEEHVSEHFTDSFRQAFDDASTSDLTIIVEDKPIYVHKAILKIRCQYFRSMFQERWQEDKEGVININEFSYTAYRAFLQYLYTEEVSLPSENCLELLELASVCCEMKLKHRCEEIIQEGITVKNAVKIYSTAMKYEAKELENLCLKFIFKHMSEFILSDEYAEMNEGSLKDILRKAAKCGQCKRRKIC